MPDITDDFTEEDIVKFLDSDRGQGFIDPYRAKATEDLSANNKKLVSEKGLISLKLKDVESKYTDLQANPEKVIVNEAVDEAALQLRIDSVVTELNTTHAGAIDALTAETGGLRSKLIDGDLTLKINSEIINQGGTPGSVKVLMPHLLAKIKSNFDLETGVIAHDVVDGSGEIRYVGGKKADLASLVSAFKEDDDFKYAFGKTKKAGTGHEESGDPGETKKESKWI